MTVRVGIPRGLLYYEYFPLWQHFFTSLGAEVVQSPPTTKQLLEMGVYSSVDETCLPVKLYMGHVAALKDMVDYVFIPRVVSIKEGDYHCPKFSGLPDMARSVFPNLPPILEVIIDRSENKREFLKSIYTMGSRFTCNPARIYAAYKQALHYWREMKSVWKQSFIPSDIPSAKHALTLAVIGHSYILYDDYGNNNLLGVLTRMGVRVITPDHTAYKQAMHYAEQGLPNLFWSLGKKLYGTAVTYARQKEVDGLILVMAFQCGPDSLLMDMMNRELALHYHKPAMTLVLDEHTGEAGLVTRLEAFVDMVKRRPQR